MKKIVCMALSIMLMTGLGAALAEEIWGEWTELAPGLWQREGTVSQLPGMEHPQGQGNEAAITVDDNKMYHENGKLSWTDTRYLDAQGNVLAQLSYNYDESGTLSHGALTLMAEDGTPETIWVLMVTGNKEGFTTQVEQFSKDDMLQSRTNTVYDVAGNFVSGTRLNMETQQEEALSDAPEMDPIREAWLKSNTDESKR